MESITKPLFRLGCILMISVSTACTSTQNSSGEARLPTGETTSFRIVNNDVRMIFSHDTNAPPSNEGETPLFTVRLINNSSSKSVVIRFDNANCDPFISYSIGVHRSSGVTHEYFDNVIAIDSDIEIQVAKDEDGKQALLINNRHIPLNIKRNYRRLAVDSDGDYTLSFSGLKPRDPNKDK